MDTTDASRGLTPAEAAARLSTDGPNELPQAARDGVLHLVLEVVREPMLLMLVIAGVRALSTMVAHPSWIAMFASVVPANRRAAA